MNYRKPFQMGKVCSIILIFIMFISIINIIVVQDNSEERLMDNQNLNKSELDLENRGLVNENNFKEITTQKNNAQTEQSISTTCPPDNIDTDPSNDVILANSIKGKYCPTSSRSTRNNVTYDHDLKINSTINVNYSGFLSWVAKIGENNYPYYIVGEIGQKTIFTLTVENVGTKPVSNNHNAMFTINITDFLGYRSWEQKDFIGDLQPGHKYTMNFTWEPIYSNNFNLSCHLSFNEDQNSSNDQILFTNFITKKWTDDFEDGDISDWSGDLSSNMWHVTDSIENDPNTNGHTAPHALYHGLEESGEKDEYGEKNDFDLITPELDLRRFDKNRVAFLNFRYYGLSNDTFDKITVFVYKTSEEKWYPINIEISNTMNDTNDPVWKFWFSWPYLGINIKDYVGQLTRFRIHWHSDQIPEGPEDNDIGFYFDDFLVYGYELPPIEYDVGIEDVYLQSSNDNFLMCEDYEIIAKVTNFGIKKISNTKVSLLVKDLTGRVETNIDQVEQTMDSLKPGESTLVSWLVNPQVAGLYSITTTVDQFQDTVLENNVYSPKEFEVCKYYTPFENDEDDGNFGDDGDGSDWNADPGWVRQDVKNDPYPNEHSRTKGWFVDNYNLNISLKNYSLSLYSPIIDLDGAQENESYIGDQINISFKWLNFANEIDNLTFEYALDHTDDWALLTPTKFSSGVFSGKISDHWQHWSGLGNPSLFGHHVQFRWRFEPNTKVQSQPNQGIYIDDFRIWVIQEQYGRPKISNLKITPNSIINDSRDEVEIYCKVSGHNNPIDEVFINLELIGGPIKQSMNRISYNYDDMVGIHDYEYNLSITVPPEILMDDYVLKLRAIDDVGLFDNNYLVLHVIENNAPIIIDHFPLEQDVILNENDEAIQFKITALDTEDDDNLDYTWYLNSMRIPINNLEYFMFDPEFHGDYSAGSYELKIIVADQGIPKKHTEFQWNIEVLNILPDLEIKNNDIYLSSKNVTLNDEVIIGVQVHNRAESPENNITIHFIQQSTNRSIPQLVFTEYNISLLNGNDNAYIEVNWTANISYNYLKVWVDPVNIIIEINETNNDAFIRINVSSPPEPQSPPPNNDPKIQQNSVPYIIYIAVGCLIATLISLFIVIGTEFGQYQFFLGLAPLYSRVTGDKILEHKLRSKIYMHIRAHPGDHYRSIMAKLKIKNGTLVHHLARLEQEELIKSERDGYFKRFYPIDMRIPTSDVGMYYPEAIPTFNIGQHQVSEIQLRIIKTIKEKPGLTQKEIAFKIKESRRVINYHIKLLEQHELIEVVKSGRETQCFLVAKPT